jgi:hypothetical protein
MGTRDGHTVAKDRMEWRGIILDYRASEEKRQNRKRSV